MALDDHPYLPEQLMRQYEQTLGRQPKRDWSKLRGGADGVEEAVAAEAEAAEGREAPADALLREVLRWKLDGALRVFNCGPPPPTQPPTRTSFFAIGREWVETNWLGVALAILAALAALRAVKAVLSWRRHQRRLRLA